MLHNEESANDPRADGDAVEKRTMQIKSEGTHVRTAVHRARGEQKCDIHEREKRLRRRHRRRTLDRTIDWTCDQSVVGTGRLALIAGLPPVNTGDGATGSPTAVWILRRQIDSVEARILYGIRSCFWGNSSRVKIRCAV